MDKSLTGASRAGARGGGGGKGADKPGRGSSKAIAVIIKLEKAVGAAGEYKNTNCRNSKLCLCAANHPIPLPVVGHIGPLAPTM